LPTAQRITKCTRSPFVPDMPRRAQSGKRTSFGRRVGFIESYTVLAIFFF